MPNVLKSRLTGVIKLINDIDFRDFPDALLEVKLLQCLQYCLMKDHDLFTQTVNSVQRQIRLQPEREFLHVPIIDQNHEDGPERQEK